MHTQYMGYAYFGLKAMLTDIFFQGVNTDGGRTRCLFLKTLGCWMDGLYSDTQCVFSYTPTPPGYLKHTKTHIRRTLRTHIHIQNNLWTGKAL